MGEGLIVIVLGMLVLAVIGHGIWLVAAALLRAILGTADNNDHKLAPLRPPTRNQCPICTSPFDAGQMACDVCGWPARTPTRAERPELAANALQRMTKRFERMGWLDAAAVKHLQEAVEAAKQASAKETIVELSAAEHVVERPPHQEPPRRKPKPTKIEPYRQVPTHAEMSAAEPPAAEEPMAEPPAPPQKPAPPLPVRAPEPVRVPEPPREVRPFAKILAAFLEEKNIRWGELIGGLLIVCSSIALVLSFWQTIAQRPLLKFGLFNGVTAALFGIGLYVERRWRLPTTTHGILLIAVLLVPLNFLAIAAFTLDIAPTDALTIGGEILSLAVFAGLTYLAARVLVDAAAVHLASAVIGCAAMELLVRRFVATDSSTTRLFIMGLPPIALFGAASMWWTRRCDRGEAFGDAEVNLLFKIVGTTLFAALLPLGLLLAKVGPTPPTLARLAPLVSLLGVPLLAAGLVMWRRLTDPELARAGVAGTSLAVAGVGAMVAGMAIGWPSPAGMLPTAVLNAVVFTWAAMRCRIPAAHLPAALCAAWAYLVGFHVVVGNLAWHGNDFWAAAEAIVSGLSGTALTVPVALLGAVAWRRGEASKWYAAAAGVVAAASIALVAMFSLGVRGDFVYATWVYAFYAAAAIVASLRTRWSLLGYVGAGVWFAALAQGLCFRYVDWLPTTLPWLYVFLAHAATMLAVALSLRWRGWCDGMQASRPLFEAGQCSSWLAVPLLIHAAYYGYLLDAAVGLTVLTAVWGLVVVASTSPGWFALFQTASYAATAQWAYLLVARQAWFYDAEYPPSLDPRTWQAIGLAWAALSGGWLALRRAIRMRDVLHHCTVTGESVAPNANDEPPNRLPVLNSPHPAECSWMKLLAPNGPLVDRFAAYVLVALVVALSIYAVTPGVCQELSPRGTSTPAERHVPSLAIYEWSGVPHVPAFGVGSWTLLAATVGVTGASLWEGFRRRKLIALAILGVAASMLFAGQWERDVAAASALRWTSAAAFLLLSLPFWRSDLVARLAARCAWLDIAERLPGLRRTMFWSILVLTLTPPLLMTVGMSAAAVARYRTPVDVSAALFACAVIAAVGIGIAAMLAAAQRRFVERSWSMLGAAVTALLSAAPLVATTIFLVAMALKTSPVLGPDPASWFVRSGLAVSYAVPVLLIAATLVGHAIAGRSPATAVAASLVLNLGATSGYLLAIAKGGLQFDAALWLRLAHLNAGVSAAFALAWSSAMWRRNVNRVACDALPSAWFTLQTALAAALIVSAVAIPTWQLCVDPTGQWWPTLAFAATDIWAWSSFAAALAAVAIYFRGIGRPISVASWSIAGMGIVALAALEATAYQLNGGIVLVWGWTLESLAMAAVGWWFASNKRLGFGPPSFVAFWAGLVSLPVIVLAAERFIDDGHRAHYVFALMIQSALWAGLGAWVASRARLFVAAALINVWVTYWWIEPFSQWFYRGNYDDLEMLFFINLTAGAIATPLWLWIELCYIRPRIAVVDNPNVIRPSWPQLYRVTALISLTLMSLSVYYGLAGDLAGRPLETPYWLVAPAMLATLVAVGACLWDAAANWSVFAMYLAGLTALAFRLDRFNLPPDRIGWTTILLLAAYALGTSYLWSRRVGLADICAAIGIPRRTLSTEEGDAAAASWHSENRLWLLPANYMLALVVVVLAYWCILTFDLWRDRFAAAQAVLAAAVSVGLLARGERRTAIQRRALELGVVGLLAVAWSFLDPGMVGEFLNRAVMVAAALAGTIALYGIGFSKVLRHESEWTAAARSLVPRLIVFGGLALAVVLGAEVWETIVFGRVAIAPAASGTVIVGLLGLIVAAIVAAVVPGRDPLGLSERGRTAYVYGAEVILALLFLHVRLTMPHLFAGFYLRYWPVMVMLLAFIGVGLSEVFRRRRQAVLSEPLERTGAFLPLLPVFGFWMLPATRIDYSLLLMGVGLLYGTLAVMRRSFGFGLLALLACNGGLWYFLNRQDGLGWLEHPQLWLVPPALCVLVAAHLNRRNLGERETTAIRYASAAAIYVASTADIFLNGVAEAPYLPLVLGGLSLVGIFAGIALRVRAFLFLGTAFLLLALTTVIWHAGYNLDQTWIFYVTGIVVGVLIIAVFAVFEKKRQEVLQVVEKLREWEG